MRKFTKADKIAVACNDADDYADRAYGSDGFTATFDRNHAEGERLIKTVRPTQKSTVRESVTLATPKATVTSIAPKGRDLSWLMADCLSVDSAYRS